VARPVVRRPRARTVRRTGLGLAVGAVGGWLAGPAPGLVAKINRRGGKTLADDLTEAQKPKR